MNVNKEELLAALNSASFGLSSGCDPLAPPPLYIFREDRIFTYNDALASSVPFKTGMSFAVPSGEFYKIISKMKDEVIKLDLKENEILILGKRVRAGINLVEVSDLPLDFPNNEDFKELPSNFIQALSGCIFTCSRDQSQLAFSSIHIGKEWIESTDVVRITRFSLDGKMEKDFLLSVKASKELSKLVLNKYTLLEGWVVFRSENGIDYYSRYIDIDYPSLTQFLSKDGIKTKLPPDLRQALDKADIFDDPSKDVYTEFRFSKDSLLVKGTGNVGWFEERLESDYDGEPIVVQTLPKFLMEVIPLIDEVYVSKDKMIFAGESFVHAICIYG